MKKIIHGIFFICVFGSLPSYAINQDTVSSRFHPTVAKNGMVVAEEQHATAAGVAILQQGGNAVDAAVATAFALSVTYQSGGGLGGGGFMLVHLAEQDKTIAINYREKAPLAATREMFIDKEGEVDREAISHTHRSAGVPGTVAGLIYAHEKYGKLPLAKVIQPAIDLAANGYVISEQFAAKLASRKAQIAQWPGSRAVYMPNGKLLQAGDKLVQKDLAKTLRLIAKQGRKAFYQGEIGKKIVADMQKNDGLITAEDLAHYTVEELAPVTGTFDNYEIVSMPPPSAGGVALIQLLNLLEPFPLAAWGLNSAATMQVMSEAMNLVYADRNELGDPQFVKNPVAQLLDQDYLDKRRQLINRKQHTPTAKIKPGLASSQKQPAVEAAQTTSFSVVDKDRNLVANTFSLNYMLGTAIIVPGTGIVLNNHMDDFAAAINAPNAFGLVGSAVNEIQPGKRPLSSMAPTFIFDAKGEPVMVTGAVGGSRIITHLLQVILNVLVHNLDVATATASPRMHSQWQPDELSVEEGFSQDTLQLLKKQGNNVVLRGSVGSAQSIVIWNDKLYGAADPRTQTGQAAGY